MNEGTHATVLLVSRVHVSQLGAEIWRVQTWDGTGRTQFETGEKDAVILGANNEYADIKLLLNPETNQLIEWPKDADRSVLERWSDAYEQNPFLRMPD